eukprot:1527140-Pleurochrysis_carterae.AAC.1
MHEPVCEGVAGTAQAQVTSHSRRCSYKDVSVKVPIALSNTTEHGPPTPVFNAFSTSSASHGGSHLGLRLGQLSVACAPSHLSHLGFFAALSSSFSFSIPSACALSALLTEVSGPASFRACGGCGKRLLASLLDCAAADDCVAWVRGGVPGGVRVGVHVGVRVG